ncbi:hypothetical protein F4777DRAFT_600232 [Nemania sp. FL0916]|nr:hypothetical protein F4777DRAFT_600232 [Nemania sp. FL0916]
MSKDWSKRGSLASFICNGFKDRDITIHDAKISPLRSQTPEPRKRNRPNRPNRKNSIKGGGSGHGLDRDDDVPMQGTEQSNNPASSTHYRGPGHNNNNTNINTNNNNSNRINKGQNKNNRTPRNRDLFRSFVANPFRDLNSDKQAVQDSQGKVFWSNRNRNRARKQSQAQQSQSPFPHHYYNRRTPNSNSNINSNSHSNHNHNSNNYNNYQQQPHNQNQTSGTQDSSSPLSPTAPANDPSFSFPAPTSALGGRGRMRFCTECSAVRRANLRLRDRAASALAHAAEVLDRWSDEVGVGRGAGGDEMDWQPEPVVRVLILTTPSATAPTIPTPVSDRSVPAASIPNAILANNDNNNANNNSNGIGAAGDNYVMSGGLGFGGQSQLQQEQPWATWNNGNRDTFSYTQPPTIHGDGKARSSWDLRPGVLSPTFSPTGSTCGGGILGTAGGGPVTTTGVFERQPATKAVMSPPESPPLLYRFS